MIFSPKNFFTRLDDRGDPTPPKTKPTRKNRLPTTTTRNSKHVEQALRATPSDWEYKVGSAAAEGVIGPTAGAHRKSDCWNKQVTELLVGSEPPTQSDQATSKILGTSEMARIASVFYG